MRSLKSSFWRPRSLRFTSTITLKNTLLNGSTCLILSPQSDEEEKKKIYNWYNCGPTVYENSHLGHARTYLSIDIIYRILTSYFNLPINYALGMTDIDDKIIKKSVETQRDWLSIARECEASYMNDMARLNIIRPHTILRVTEHIPDIIQYIEKILENGKGYVTETGVYFDIQSSITSYGKLGNIPTGEEGGGDVSTTRGKRDPRDFALWKIVDPSTPHWESPWGPGRPGWHIECSAMTHAYFGPKVDIHSGGIDLRFPHHTNEIAQR
jgi:cysteinyl-tRNA synthetase